MAVWDLAHWSGWFWYLTTSPETQWLWQYSFILLLILGPSRGSSDSVLDRLNLLTCMWLTCLIKMSACIYNQTGWGWLGHTSYYSQAGLGFSTVSWGSHSLTAVIYKPLSSLWFFYVCQMSTGESYDMMQWEAPLTGMSGSTSADWWRIHVHCPTDCTTLCPSVKSPHVVFLSILGFAL